MNIIIAGDVPMLASLLKMAIQDSGYDDISIAANQEDLLMMCFDAKPQVIIIDLHIPETHCLRLIEQILDLDSKISVIVVAEAADNLGTKVLSAGARAYLEKPFSIFDIRETIKKVKPIL
ncbi:response regulator [Candidatus Thorarchaeota archaeon]|nr:MAG: response regulator [Candidatus Thorarchaeota archaeon]